MSTPETESPIDTSHHPAGERAALEITEAAREATGKERTFVGNLFFGRLDFSGLASLAVRASPDPLPPGFPWQSEEDRESGATFLRKLEDFLRDQVDPDAIDAEGEIPDSVLDGLAALGAFGIKIPTEYGGLGLSQFNYCRAAMLLGSTCGNLTALLSAHQSIGVPQPLLLFGTEAQKKKYLPRVAAGEISAFALTEAEAGSDPARMETHAEPRGDDFILNGRKMWCTNGTRAGVLVVMAKTPPKEIHGRIRDQITAFIVETSWPGVKVVQRCRFMGLHALYNAVIDFHDVVIPRENILLAEGKGLRVALSTLNTGRLTLPAACVGLAKRCLAISTRWGNERVQWGKPIAEHAAIADKIAAMAAATFAMESITMLTASWVDQGREDFRLESALCKMLASEWTWQIVNDTMQIRGGRGYETAASLRERGEAPDPVERMLRDSRINTIFEGSSEIMRLFVAREALDPHLKIGGPVLDSRLPLTVRAKAALRAGLFYSHWYPGCWWPRGTGAKWAPRWHEPTRWCETTSRRLARELFHHMIQKGPALEKHQLLLGRFVEIGAEVFALSAVLARVQGMASAGAPPPEWTLADYCYRSARLRVEARFHAIAHNLDWAGFQLAGELGKEVPRVLLDGIVR